MIQITPVYTKWEKLARERERERERERNYKQCTLELHVMLTVGHMLKGKEQTTSFPNKNTKINNIILVLAILCFTSAYITPIPV